MFLGYQENKIKYYVEQPLNPSIYNVDRWEETNEEYVLDGDEYVLNDAEYKKKQAQKEREQKAKDFFYTSLGYVRRKVTMATGEIRDFLFDIKPTLQIGIPIITYNEDGTQNRGVLVTEEFLKECDKQIYFDFYGSYPEV